VEHEGMLEWLADRCVRRREVELGTLPYPLQVGKELFILATDPDLTRRGSPARVGGLAPPAARAVAAGGAFLCVDPAGHQRLSTRTGRGGHGDGASRNGANGAGASHNAAGSAGGGTSHSGANSAGGDTSRNAASNACDVSRSRSA